MNMSSDPGDQHEFIVRLAGDLTTKSRRVRRRFQRRLIENMSEAIRSAGVDHTVDNLWSRLLVRADSGQALEPLTRVFGVHSISPIQGRCRSDLDEIVRTGAALFCERVRGKTYAVRATRTGDPPFRSHDIQVQLGSALNRHAKVDLDDPEVTVQVDVRGDETIFYSEHFPGPGGLPLGSQDSAVALFSGGFDSAVAAWSILKRGVCLDYVLCNLAGAAYERSVLGVAKVLADSWSFGSRPRLHIVDFQEIVPALKRDINSRYLQVVLKRLMYRVGCRIAAQLHGLAIVTGESIGQVSSQTLANLRTIDEAADLPVLRPLIGLDKREIVDQSRHIGTYALSASVQEYCALSDERPSTAARLKVIRDEEARLHLPMLDAVISERKIVDIRALTDDELVLPYLYTNEVPEDAVVIDCRGEHQFDAWHYPGARRFDLDQLLTRYRRLERERTYVLYCPIGVQSAVAAEKMQSAGYEAYSFRGGSTALRKYVEDHDWED